MNNQGYRPGVSSWTLWSLYIYIYLQCVMLTAFTEFKGCRLLFVFH